MALRYGSREQINMFPAVIEDYVGEEAPVRAYDAMVEAMDFNNLRRLLLDFLSVILFPLL